MFHIANRLCLHFTSLHVTNLSRFTVLEVKTHVTNNFLILTQLPRIFMTKLVRLKFIMYIIIFCCTHFFNIILLYFWVMWENQRRWNIFSMFVLSQNVNYWTKIAFWNKYIVRYCSKHKFCLISKYIAVTFSELNVICGYYCLLHVLAFVPP